MSGPPLEHCRFFNGRGGCRRGTSCRYLHDRAANGRARDHSPSLGGAQTLGSASAPPGVCRTFWIGGECRYGFQCRYRHELSPRHAPAAPLSHAQGTATAAVDTIAPLLNAGGLAKLTERSTDSFFAADSSRQLGPSEVHNHLKRYLFDNYRFRHVLDMYSFVKLIGNASVNNELWSPEDGQLLLTTLSSGNGLLRVNDILAWEDVSISAGDQRTKLSFQRGYVPLLRYFSSEHVANSVASHAVNALYSLILEHCDHFANVVQTCMEEAINVKKSFKDPRAFVTGGKDPLVNQVLAALVKVLFELVTRFKNVLVTHPPLRPLVLALREWMDKWITGITSTPPTLDDPLSAMSSSARDHIIQHLKGQVDRLVCIVERKNGEMERIEQRMRDLALATTPSRAASEGLIAALENAYEGPGELRREGPRHDNDFVNISDIRIAPTHDELTCRAPPFLPASFYGAPHPFPSESAERLLDIQFRLLREELIASLRTSIQLVFDDLLSPTGDTRLAELMRHRGGKYRGHVANQDAVLFNTYTNVSFGPPTPDRRGMSIALGLDSPPGRARSSQSSVRVKFWDNMASKRLMQGGLVALIWQRPNRDLTVYLGTIASSARDLVESARHSVDRLSIRVAFFDAELDLRAVEGMGKADWDDGGVKLLVEATVLYESVRPFLDALRVEPETVPFGKYLTHHPPEYLSRVSVSLPAYARVPDFSFRLSSLFSPDAGVGDLVFRASDPESIATARQLLRERSILDPSQADAVIMALTSELALIQGPPGTGKSYTGVQLLRVLLANEIGPILMIAFTNHALDHLLCSVLDTGVTKKIVRLGRSKATDERIAEFSIEHMEEVAGRSRLDRAFSGNYRALRDVEEEIKRLMTELRKTSVDSGEISSHMELAFPGHFEFMNATPQWIKILYELERAADGPHGWLMAERGSRDQEVDTSLYAFWLAGHDLDFLEHAHAPPDFAEVEPTSAQRATSAGINRYGVLAEDSPEDAVGVPDPALDSLGSHEEEGSGAEDDELDVAPEEVWRHMVIDTSDDAGDPTAVTDCAYIPQVVAPQVPDVSGSTVLQPTDFHDVNDFFLACGLPGKPPIPQRDRVVQMLLDGDGEDVWAYSRHERRRFHAFIQAEVRTTLHKTRIMEFERLRQRHRDAARKYNEGKDETRRQLLRNVDIIGCTTTGAAKLTSLLKGIGPRVMLVEEAGQVLEAHVLGSLVESVQHLIMIGDPLQLRPNLNNYSLSVDHRRGGLLYKFDMSLMERLSSGGFPMSQIDVQRRMRPEISHLVRTTLYPKLEDHDLVKQYSHVQGMGADVFFLSHNHAENGSEDDAVSKYNDYEVSIIKDLVIYLLRQGPYSADGDIVVLCAYLGQLARVRDALAGQVVTVIDERDQRELDDRESEKSGDEPPSVATVERVQVTRKVLLRTVDNFQGEEAKIVILSLVRNSGGVEENEMVYGYSSTKRANIGFLKSSNRINVALSRAREGMYIMGNASDLKSRSKMWSDVISELEQQGCVGNALPICCNRHPDRIEHISEAGQLPRISPDGGCLLQCDARLECGHICPYKCHSDDPNHHSVVCEQRCTRLCVRGHPCMKQCAAQCGKCMTLIENVELPCGHNAAHVYCHQLDTLSEVPCNVRMTKKLPTCEHSAMMSCSQDLSSVLCREPCNGIMGCCGRNCKALCSQCQGLNAANDKQSMGQIPRMSHIGHPCEKTLYCGHLCGKACSEGHQCVTHCKAPCRQVCPHAHCRSYCSTPCAPCQEPCTWQCKHHVCNVPCGSVCIRLPCDKPCERFLRCGHRCPSVCGEDCMVQVCPACLSEDKKDGIIVDLIMNSTLAMVKPENGTLDELLITLPNCRHVFTVETLDGICALHEYYFRDELGRWTGLKAPPSEFLKPPACPTCRSAITAPRYGRVFKSADLDILENNVASHMSQSLVHLQSDLNTVSKDQLAVHLRAAAAKVAIVKHSVPIKAFKHCQKNQAIALKAIRFSPIPLLTIDPANASLHAISTDEARLWRKVTQKLLGAYNRCVNVANMRSAHLRAWEASFSYLYQREMDTAAEDPEHAPRNPHEYAMRAARIGVGLPQPRADKRFVVEAIWTSITVRLLLVDLTIAWSKALQARERYPAESRRAWATYISFLLRSCAADLDIASTITEESESRRQFTKCALLKMRVDLEQFRFNLETTKQSGKLADVRQKLEERVRSKLNTSLKTVQSILSRHRRAQIGTSQSEEVWLSANFTQASNVIVKEWETIAQSIRNCTFYQPVSLDELTAIVKSFHFGHAGHYYKCPNGHVYVIADCGGAMERSVCPECGASIGGSSHRVADDNSRAFEMEQLAIAHGAQGTPW